MDEQLEKGVHVPLAVIARSEYHNMRVKIPADVHLNFILAHLARAVFPMIQKFSAVESPDW
jgi:hypothetical protein